MNKNYFFENTDEFSIDDSVFLNIDRLISDENKTEGELSFIFCSDDYLLKMNKDYLNHDFYTDVITFDYSVDDTISGDVFISVDRVKENAKTYFTSFDNELHRVMVHGVLHLAGYKDKSDEEKKEMRKKENKYLKLDK